ncbi:uncharacterized protein LOC111250127 isoform X1 [Varroa destructor]|uniref:BACK domain-containing protein n=1 Tax=Varroa destructor TaxID=109461 RepID=A0A7M7MGN7_VARDE|nr:uncharacterized protein LOC111250127 isoform X1 [Varroa destructor]
MATDSEVQVRWSSPSQGHLSIRPNDSAKFPWKSISGLYVPIYVYGNGGYVGGACARVLSAFSPRFAKSIEGSYLYVDASNETVTHLLNYMTYDTLPNEWCKLLNLHELARSIQQTVLEEIVARQLVSQSNIYQKVELIRCNYAVPVGALRQEILKNLASIFGTDDFKKYILSQYLLTEGMLRDLLARDDLCVTSENDVASTVKQWVTSMNRLGYPLTINDFSELIQRPLLSSANSYLPERRSNSCIEQPLIHTRRLLAHQHVHFIGVSDEQRPHVNVAVTSAHFSSSSVITDANSTANTGDTRVDEDAPCMNNDSKVRFRLYCAMTNGIAEIAKSQIIEFKTLYRQRTILNSYNKIVYHDNCVRYEWVKRNSLNQNIQNLMQTDKNLTLKIKEGVERRGPTMFLKYQGCLLQMFRSHQNNAQLHTNVLWKPTSNKTFLADICVCEKGLVALFCTVTEYGEAIYTYKHFPKGKLPTPVYTIAGINSWNPILVASPVVPSSFFVLCPSGGNSPTTAVAVSLLHNWPMPGLVPLEPEEADIRYDDYIAEDLEGLFQMFASRENAAMTEAFSSNSAERKKYIQQFRVVCHETQVNDNFNGLAVTSRDGKYIFFDLIAPNRWQLIGFVPHQFFLQGANSQKQRHSDCSGINVLFNKRDQPLICTIP